MRCLVLCLLLALAGGPAHAGAPNWSVLDLGRLYKNNHCMEAALASFESLLAEVSIGQLRRSDWVTYADGIGDGGHDAVIVCTYGDNRGTRATLIIHSQKNPISARIVTRRIAQIFEGESARITKAWKDSYR